FLAASILAEPAVELPVVPAVHVAVPVEVEVPQVVSVGGRRPIGRAEAVAVLSVHIAIPVRVAEQPAEAVHPIAARGAVAVTVQLPPPAAVYSGHAGREGRGTL